MAYPPVQSYMGTGSSYSPPVFTQPALSGVAGPGGQLARIPGPNWAYASPQTLSEQLAAAAPGGSGGGLVPITPSFAAQGPEAAAMAAAEAGSVGGGSFPFLGKAVTNLAGKLPGSWANPEWAGSWAGMGIPLGMTLASKPLGGLVQQLSGSHTAGSMTKDALQLGGLGAGLGSFVGPEGTLIGGLVGGAAGLAKGYFMDKEPTSLQDQGFHLLSAYNVPADIQNQIRATYTQLQGADKKTADQWLSSVVGQAQQSFMTNSNPFASQSPEQNLQLQQLAGQAMSPYVQNSATNADAAAKALTDHMGNLTPAQRDQLSPLVKQYTDLSKNVSNAYALQAEQFPIQNQIAKSAWATLQAGGSSGGLSALLAQQASTPTGTLPTR